jgi:hypothetical protein
VAPPAAVEDKVKARTFSDHTNCFAQLSSHLHFPLLKGLHQLVKGLAKCICS